MITLYYRTVPDKKEEHDAAYRLLLSSLQNRYGGFEVLPHMETGEFGKPFFPDSPEIHFNLSHAGGWAVCALADAPVGIDIINERKNRTRAADKFTAEEREYLKSCPESVFFDFWAKKEAFLKTVGTGLTRRLDSFSVLPLEGNEPESGLQNVLVPFPADYFHCAVCGAERPEPGWIQL